MTNRFGKNNKQKAGAGFSLAEVIMSIGILGLVMSGMLYGYIQTNRRAEWNSMSLMAQSAASAATEQALAAKWYGHGTILDELQVPGSTNYTRTNLMIIPATGQLVIITNYVSITNILNNPPLRQIRVDCSWKPPNTTTWLSNTVITCRTLNQ
jgi:type II secretory pathway pseudopilin PulG